MTLTLICESCGTIFEPDEASEIDILDSGYARYGCPECPYVVRSVPPKPAEVKTE